MMPADLVPGVATVLAAIAFGLWQQNVYAGLFMFNALVAIVKCLRNMDN